MKNSLKFEKSIKTFRESDNKRKLHFMQNDDYSRLKTNNLGLQRTHSNRNEFPSKQLIYITKPIEDSKQLPGSKFKIKILEEDISDMSHDSGNGFHLSPSKMKLGINTKAFTAGPTKVRVRRKSQEPAKTERTETKKKFLLIKKVKKDGRKIKGPLPGTLEFDMLQGENKFLKKANPEEIKKSNKPNKKIPKPPLKVVRDEEELFMRRSLVGTPEQFHTVMKANIVRSK